MEERTYVSQNIKRNLESFDSAFSILYAWELLENQNTPRFRDASWIYNKLKRAGLSKEQIFGLEEVFTQVKKGRFRTYDELVETQKIHKGMTHVRRMEDQVISCLTKSVGQLNDDAIETLRDRVIIPAVLEEFDDILSAAQ